MAEEDLFEGLPPPSDAAPPSPKKRSSPPPNPPPAVKSALKKTSPPAPALKSALKREKPSKDEKDEAPAPQKRLQFKTTTDATETQVLEAMQKIASYIKNPTKFGKASKLAIQLVQAGSVKPGTADQFFAILEASMTPASSCNEPSLRADYQTLFLAAQDVVEHFNQQQKNQLTTWTMQAVVANDLFTDDSFTYSKAAYKIKDAISSLPRATADDDSDEASALAQAEISVVAQVTEVESNSEANTEASDPFGLDALLPSTSKKEEKTKGELMTSSQKAEEESKRFIKSQREVLLLCLEIAARRYKVAWAQTIIDILVKHAFDNMDRFTSRQRDAIEKLWLSIKEQYIRRKQGKSVTGKLDVTGFEWLQEKYANEKISIRHSVGGSGDHRAQQWLG